MTIDRVGNHHDRAGKFSGRVHTEAPGGMNTLQASLPTTPTGPDGDVSGADARFKATVDALAQFRDAQGRWPKQNAPNHNERKHASRLASLRQAAKGHRGGPLTPERRAYADQVLGEGWIGRSNDDEAFAANVAELAGFRTSHDRWPKQTATDPAERALAQQLNGLRQAAKGNGNRSMSARRRAYADQVLGAGWVGKSYDDEAFATRVAELAEFRDREGRWPSGSSTDSAEKRLGEFRHDLAALSTRDQRQRLTDERMRTIERELGAGWEPASQREADFRARLENIAEFRSRTGRWPSQHAREPEERELAHRLHAIRQYHKPRTGQDSPPRPERQMAEEILGPDWQGRTLGFQDFTDRVDAIAEHKRRTGRWPSTESKDPLEARLANQLIAIRQSSRGKGTNLWDEQRKAYAETTLGAGWEGVGNDHRGFMQRVDQIADFVARTGHMPRESRGGEEGRLARRVKHMRRGARGLGTLRVDAERRAYIDERLGPDWADPSKEQQQAFMERVDEIADFVARTGRLPRRARDSDEGRTGQWLYDMRRGARGLSPSRVDAERRAYIDERLGPDWLRG